MRPSKSRDADCPVLCTPLILQECFEPPARLAEAFLARPGPVLVRSEREASWQLADTGLDMLLAAASHPLHSVALKAVNRHMDMFGEGMEAWAACPAFNTAFSRHRHRRRLQALAGEPARVPPAHAQALEAAGIACRLPCLVQSGAGPCWRQDCGAHGGVERQATRPRCTPGSHALHSAAHGQCAGKHTAGARHGRRAVCAWLLWQEPGGRMCAAGLRLVAV